MTLSPSRRTLLKGAAWSAPVVLTSTAVPAYAASSTEKTYSALSGVFAQVFNTNSGSDYDTIFGSNSYDGAVTTSNGTANSSTGLAAAGAGNFTPGGSLENDLYGGSGFWFSAPVDQTTGEFVAGTVTLTKGSTFTMEYTFTFATADDVFAPLIGSDTWETSSTYTYPFIEGATAIRTAFNGVALYAAYGEPMIEDNVWKGTITFTTQDDLVVSTPEVPYTQLLTSQAMVYYEGKPADTVSATITATNAVLLVVPTDGKSSTVIATGATATATL